MKRLLISVAVIVVTVAVFKLWPERPLDVTVTYPENGQVAASVANTRSGTIIACQRSKLSLPLGGQVAILYVGQGDKVEAGAPLMELWNEDVRANLANAEAQQTVAALNRDASCRQAESQEREAKRIKNLHKRQMATAEQLDKVQTLADVAALQCKLQDALIEQAQANYELQKAHFTQTQLRAPFAGIVAEVNAEIGEYATPSPPGVATPPAIDLINPDCLYVQAPIDEVDASQVSLGMPVNVTLDAFGDRSFNGKVSRISPYIQDEAKQARTVDVDVILDPLPEDVHMLIGYSADIEVITARTENTLRIPTELLLEGSHVMAASNGIATQIEVGVGLSNWTWTEITSGLDNTTQLINEPSQAGLEADTKVKVISPSLSEVTQ
jgi:HlyD family secretion protein